MKKFLIIIAVLCLLAGCSAQSHDFAAPISSPGTSQQPPDTSGSAAPAQESEKPSSVAFDVTEPPQTSADTSQPQDETTPAETTPTETTPAEATPVQTTPVQTTESMQTPDISPEPTHDAYNTDPVPEGKPEPVEPQNSQKGEGVFTCTLSVRCDTILDNIVKLDPEKLELVPDDGIIFEAQTVTFYEGESVFNILQREMRRAKIHMEFVNTPIYNSAYIEGINNLYEFDCGELSGWMYKVNDWFPNYGCSRYQLKDGDVVEWIYTCDLGRDIGGEGAVGGS